MRRRSGKPASSRGTPSDPSERKLIDLLSSSVRNRSLRRLFAAGEPIVSEGDAGPSAFILLSGFCEVSVHGEVISHVSQGEVFGEIACLEGGTRTASVRAARDSEILEIAADDLAGRTPPVPCPARPVPQDNDAPRSGHFPTGNVGTRRAS